VIKPLLKTTRDDLAAEHGPLWTGKLRVRGSHFIGDEANVLTALREAPELRGMVRYNEFRNTVEVGAALSWRAATVGEAWTERDDLDLQRWLQELNLDVRQRGIVSDCVERVARDAAYHPVRDYLEALDWDGTPRLNRLFEGYFAAAGDPTYLSAIGAKFAISAVARVLKPGCQVDHVPVLDGEQGIGKTSSVRILAGDFVADGLPNLHDKDSAIYLQGVWIVELAELAAIRRTADLESTKAFLSRTTDRFRPPYGRRTIDMPRQCVFVATTNERQYLRDPTGNRRFWPISCGRIDLNGLARDRDQLWAEAVALYIKGRAWHLNGEESAAARKEQSARVYVTELEQQVTEHLDGLIDRGMTSTTIRDVLVGSAGLNPESERFTDLAGKLGPQVAAILSRNDWHRVGAVGRSPNRRVMYRYQPEAHRGS
jgi:predicted P-loop ATPase